MTSIPLPFELPTLARGGSRPERPRIVLYAWWAPIESETETLLSGRQNEVRAAKDCADSRSGSPA
ncbi:MAG: hypothetical protein KF785_12145 [Gemmatimonadales bacterium]|nr:hypothetical protein [Gemmatimonadales bacterium]